MLVLAALWLVGGLVILWYAGLSHFELIQGPEPFDVSRGPEQSVLIFETEGLYALIEGTLISRAVWSYYWLRKALSFWIILSSFAWLLFGGPAYEPWYFSSAIAVLLVASGWSLALSRPTSTPNNTVERERATAARAPHRER